jgi:hypothetical protein
MFVSVSNTGKPDDAECGRLPSGLRGIVEMSRRIRGRGGGLATVLATVLLALRLRVLLVAATAALWVTRDLGPGLRDVGLGLVRLPGRPAHGARLLGWGAFDVLGGLVFGLVSMVPQVVGRFRALTEPEVQAGRLVYADTIPWSRVRVYVGSYVARLASRATGEPTAVVTMRVVHVPASFDTSTSNGRAWLVHELMHVWQGQHTGPSCMARALVGQRGRGYDYGGLDGLRAHAEQGLAAFNPEQQADVMRGYYKALLKQADLRPYQPYVDEVLAPSLRPTKRGP